MRCCVNTQDVYSTVLTESLSARSVKNICIKKELLNRVFNSQKTARIICETLKVAVSTEAVASLTLLFPGRQWLRFR